MKALEILKTFSRYYTGSFAIKMKEAIAELEALENRSCESCKYSYYDKEDAIVICTNEDNNQEYLYNSKMQITLDFYCNKWESKC